MSSSGFAPNSKDSTDSTPSLVTRQLGTFLFGYGKKDLTFDELVKRYPEIKWANLKQIHSDKIIEAVGAIDSVMPNESLVEADAHFTRESNLALLIKSADCVPVLIACDSAEQEPAVCAIHAGWRGVNSDIVTKSVRVLLENGYAPTRMQVAIGPHIRQKSFDVGLDVAKELKETALRAGLRDLSKIIIPDIDDPAKRRIDLEAIVRAQLKSFQIPDSAIDTVGEIDTRTSLEWSSFRRNGASAGRNLSFIAKVNLKK
jgi:polyphenol oxidase